MLASVYLHHDGYPYEQKWWKFISDINSAVLLQFRKLPEMEFDF